MDLSPYVDAIREDFRTAAAAGDEQTQRTAATLGAALEPAVRLAIMNALADLAAEVTAQLPEHVVDVRLDGRDVRVAITPTGTGERNSPDEPVSAPGGGRFPFSAPDAGGDISRITLRLFEQVKGQAEQAAAAKGVSLNTFVSQAVNAALHGAGERGGQHKDQGSSHAGGNTQHEGSRLRGWVQG